MFSHVIERAERGNYASVEASIKDEGKKPYTRGPNDASARLVTPIAHTGTHAHTHQKKIKAALPRLRRNFQTTFSRSSCHRERFEAQEKNILSYRVTFDERNVHARRRRERKSSLYVNPFVALFDEKDATKEVSRKSLQCL